MSCPRCQFGRVHVNSSQVLTREVECARCGLVYDFPSVVPPQNRTTSLRDAGEREPSGITSRATGGCFLEGGR